jgi:hypothetical protein
MLASKLLSQEITIYFNTNLSDDFALPRTNQAVSTQSENEALNRGTNGSNFEKWNLQITTQ